MSDMQLDVLYELWWEVGGGLGKLTANVKRTKQALFDKYEPWLKQVFRNMRSSLKGSSCALAHFSHEEGLNHDLNCMFNPLFYSDPKNTSVLC